VEDVMAGKPFQSILIPYEKEIAELRSQRPPVSYARIAQLFREKYGLTIQRAGIAKFVKLRSGGRKVYFFRRDLAAKRSQSAASTRRNEVSPAVRLIVKTKPHANDDDDFGFTYSDRYNLTRLPPEEAAARRKKLEEQGH
jgi:hypothetical protein